MSWDEAFDELCIKAKEMGEMPSSNNAWGQYLQDIGFMYKAIPNTCPFCYTAADFCTDHPCGTFILGTGTHVICVKNGVILDAGAVIPESVAIVTPAAVGDYWHVNTTVTITVPCGCCLTVSGVYVDGTEDDPATTPTPSVQIRRGASLTVNRVA